MNQKREKRHIICRLHHRDATNATSNTNMVNLKKPFNKMQKSLATNNNVMQR